jgi:hypothetical protein
MSTNTKDQETRKQKRLEKLGSNHPVCVACGEDHWQCLEEHHMAGRKYDDDCAIVCANCHDRLSDSQIDHPKMIGTRPTIEERIGHMLLGLTDILLLLTEKFPEFAHYLIETTRKGNKHHE